MKKFRSITISEKYFKKLYIAARELSLLESAGVNNWQWYGEHWNDLTEFAQNDEELNCPYMILERQTDEEFERLWSEINE